ncbi:hypothetical protein BJV82DRAFT_647111 [Fennellomyces sp. T-0311]|nr:hypothetical protein BJV82DRAFT_647111 [Fennellomyces sp. T-0311]
MATNYFHPDTGIPLIKVLLDKEPQQLGIEITAGVLKKYPDPSVALHSLEIAEEVFNLTSRREFPFILQTSLELALFRTYAVPTISKLLYATGEFTRNTRKRAEDTELILLEIGDAYTHIEVASRKNPNLSQEDILQQRRRQEHAIARLNEIHGKYNILNDDFLYTLSLFVVEPMKWVNKHEWRQLEQIEINRYAEEKVRYAPTNWKVGHPTVEHLLSRFPKFMAPIVYTIIPAVLDPLDVAGFGLEPAKPWAVQLINASFHLRALFIRHLLPPRVNPLLRTPITADPKTNLYKPLYNLYEPTYPEGYCIFELGPEKYKPAKCPVPH